MRQPLVPSFAPGAPDGPAFATAAAPRVADAPQMPRHTQPVVALDAHRADRDVMTSHDGEPKA